MFVDNFFKVKTSNLDIFNEQTNRNEGKRYFLILLSLK